MLEFLGLLSIFQIQSRPGCNVAQCPTQELHWSGRTAALTKMSFIPSVVDKFLYSPLFTLKLRAEMIITASPFTT